MKPGGRDRRGASPGKLVLVGVLAVLFIGVLASNFRAVGDEPVAVGPPPDASPTGVVEPAAPTGSAPTKLPSNPFGQFAEEVGWPAPQLEQLVAFDPLDAPSWLASVESAAADGQAGQEVAFSLEEMQQADSAIIFVAGEERVARIGAQDYRIGDMVGPYQITDISSAGIVLSEPVGNAGEP